MSARSRSRCHAKARATRLVLGLTLALATASWSSSAHADEADRLFSLGRRASEMGKYSTACSLFRESFRLEPAAGTLLNLGDCEEQQNHLAAALDYYQEALSRMGVTDDRLGPLRTRIEALEQRSGRIEVRLGEGAPRDTKVSMDGEILAPEKLKKPVVVSAGGHLLQVTAVGYRGSRQTVDVAAGQHKSVSVWPGPQLDVSELALASDDRERSDEDQQESRARTLRWVGWSAAGLGVASLWVGSVSGLFAIDRESTRRENCSADNVCNRAGVDAALSGNTLATVSTITLGAGVIAAAAGIYLIATNPSAPAPAAKTALARKPLARTSWGAVPLTGGGAASFQHEF